MSVNARDGRGSRLATLAAMAAILAVAAGLRVWGIDVGRGLGTPLGFSYHLDEPNTLVRALRMTETLDPNPDWFMYPSLLIYANFAALRLVAVFGRPDPYIVGRLLTVAFGCATVVAVYLLGRAVSGRRVGILAAVLLAVSFMHVRSSHFVTTDVPMTLFATLAGLLAYRGLSTGRTRALLAAFAAAGFAAGTKYNGAPAVLLPLAASLLSAHGPRRRALVTVAGVAVFVASFVVTTPFLVVEPRNFVYWFRFIHEYQLDGQYGFERPGFLANLAYLSSYLWLRGIGPAAGVLAVVGAVLSVRGPGRRAAVPLVAFPVAYLVWLATYRTSFTRNMMPIVPVAAVFASVALDRALERWPAPGRLARRPRAALHAVVVMAVVAWPLQEVVRWDRAVARNTRTRALDWIARNLPPGSRIVTEVYGPPLKHTHPGRFRVLEKWNLGRDVPSPDWFREVGADFVVSNSGAWEMAFSNPGQYPEAERLYRGLAERCPLVREFPGDTVDPLYSSVSPTIRIYDCRPHAEGP